MRYDHSGDLKNYESGFRLFSDNEAAVLVALILFVAFVADRLGWLA